MSGEFAEIDLATDMNDTRSLIIVNEEGEEPEVRPSLDLFTEETDSSRSNSINDEYGNKLLNNSDNQTDLSDHQEEISIRPNSNPI